ncbi:FAD-dependent monooxygenase [bacterium]|nr:FAD-dependent monooxygenase [bacterium]
MGETPVLVVGAGPTGLMLAGELARHGIPARIVEKSERPALTSRAIGVHARTLEVLDQIGIADDLIARGVKVHAVSAFAHGKKIVGLSLDELDSPFPFVLAVPQTETEAVLRGHVEKHGGRIEWSTELVSLEQGESGVVALLKRPDGSSESFLTSWIVGCDGAHSAVRHALGLSFEGGPYDETFLLADVHLESDLARDEFNGFLAEEGPLILFPLPGGLTRLIAALGPAPPGPPPPEPVIEDVRAALARAGVPRAEVRDPVWISRFRIHHRLVHEYRKGRVFLAGDAAHIHSPAGGQGMNTGIQDAENLAWKLALVIRGAASEALLDSYGIERHAIALGVVRGTDVATRAATLRNPVAQALRNHLAHFLAGLEVVRQRIARTVSGVALSYANSPIVGEHRSLLHATVTREKGSEPSLGDWLDFGSGPGPGSRALDAHVSVPASDEPRRLFRVLRGTRHSLLLFVGARSTESGHLEEIARSIERTHGDLVSPHLVVHAGSPPTPFGGSTIVDRTSELHHRYGAGSECLYLVRPDGYIGYRSQPALERGLRAHLDAVFLPRERRSP